MDTQKAQDKIFGLVNYVPTEAQAIIHIDETRNKLTAGGERGGKSLVQSKELLKHWFTEALPYGKKALYWLLGNDYEACRGEWEHIVEDFTKLDKKLKFIILGTCKIVKLIGKEYKVFEIEEDCEEDY